MKYIKLATVVIFSLMLLIPLAGFRFEEGIVSKIDNRHLQENPFRAKEEAKKKPLQELVTLYVNDRIGFREDMILAHTVLNDKLFGELIHPRQRYGINGYVYSRRMHTPVFGKYHETFVDMVKQIQDYCEARGVKFLFVFEPSKMSILPEYLPVGVHYDDSWVKDFFQAMDERGIHYIDNTVVLRRKTAEGETLFNRQFDPLHWNEMGMYYGANAILSELHTYFPGIHPIDISNFNRSKTLRTSLASSQFPICEYVPVIKVPLKKVKDYSNLYLEELERDKKYCVFGYSRNLMHLKETPRVLAFQGSYFNGRAEKFLKYALGEYVFVHDYRNVLKFPYYFNIFKPECVIFEVAEYTVNNDHFSEKRMASLHFNPPLQSVMKKLEKPTEYILHDEDIEVQGGKALTKILWNNAPKNIKHVWCLLDGEEYDMRPHRGGGYEVTIKNEEWEKRKEQMKIVTLEEGLFLYTFAGFHS